MTGWVLRLSVTHPLDVILLVDGPEGLYNFGKVFRLFFFDNPDLCKILSQNINF